MGQTGRGTHGHCSLRRIRLTSSPARLKALGGGLVACGRFANCDRSLGQTGSPTLFSNALPTTVAASAEMAIKILQEEPERVERLPQR